jgi:hypothetical protein
MSREAVIRKLNLLNLLYPVLNQIIGAYEFSEKELIMTLETVAKAAREARPNNQSANACYQEEFWKLVREIRLPWTRSVSETVFNEGSLLIPWSKDNKDIQEAYIKLFPPSMHSRLKTRGCLILQKQDDICAICIADLNMPCSTTCEISLHQPLHCQVVFGKCGHSYHEHCHLNWFIKHAECPLDAELWETIDCF